jgi:ubiquinone/menaquinone biosynthesis C-methylase UbiE
MPKRTRDHDVQRVRALYDRWVNDLPGILFMNSGLAESGPGAYAWVRPEDQIHKYHLSLIRRALQGVELADRTVLELASGRGGNCHYLSHYTDVRRVYGVDSSFGTARAAADIGATKARFICGTIEELPFPAGLFDVAVSIESSPTYPAMRQLLAEVHRVLKPGGTFVHMDLWMPDHTRLTRERVSALRNTPLRIVSEESIAEEVFQSLSQPDAVEARMRRLENDGNRQLARGIIEYAAKARESLAVGFFRARILRLVKDAGARSVRRRG